MSNGAVKKGGGGRDTVLESRHLVGVFLGVVVLCGVFFTLGYVMGRTQDDSSVRAAMAARDQAPPRAAVVPRPGTGVTPQPGPSDWGFYSAGQPKKTEDRLVPPAPRPDSATSSAASSGSMASSARPPGSVGTEKSRRGQLATGPSGKAFLRAPLIPRGSVVLQVAALAREGDALALAEALQQKEFPAFVLTPTADNLYRVQVGPFADAESATLAKRALEREGFKTIAKR